jgi:aminoglycoside phosphotransferase (APT) family kinase protein
MQKSSLSQSDPPIIDPPIIDPQIINPQIIDPQIIDPQIIDASLVHALLLEQHPDLAHLPLAHVGEGWDNAVFRLGGDLAVRLPRRAATVPLMEHEQRWVPSLAPRLPLPVPTPVRVGRPGTGYPWTWSIVRWFPGTAAMSGPRFDPRAVAITLGGFLRALHQPAPADAPHSPWRSIPLDARTARLHEHLDQLKSVVDRERILAVWDRLVVTPRWGGAATWIHGDLHPGNLLIADGQLAAVIDFGDIAAGDPATDLAVMWMMLPPEHRHTLFAAAGHSRSNPSDEQMWRRARGWALSIAVAVIALGGDDSPLAELGKRTIAAALVGGPDERI